MLTITLPAIEAIDETADAPGVPEVPALTLSFEHSLVSLSKWEEVYEKAFFGKDEKTIEETADYLRMMVVGELPEEDFVERLAKEDVKKITDYINAKRTGTWFNETPGPKKTNTQVMTNELIYSWMVSWRIPFYPAEHWHLNRLLTLIRVIGEQNTKAKPMGAKERAETYRTLNEKRRREMGSSG